MKECGTTIVECAASTGKDDPYRDPAMHTFYRFTMTYNLPQQKGEHQPLKIPKGADVLLQTALPNLSPAQRQALMEETALRQDIRCRARPRINSSGSVWICPLLTRWREKRADVVTRLIKRKPG